MLNSFRFRLQRYTSYIKAKTTVIKKFINIDL